MGGDSPSGADAGQFTVNSPDGTKIAVWFGGSGPPIVLVHGSLADHQTLELLIEALHPDFTTYALDRRGFGASGDASDYEIEREFEDVAAVIDEVAKRAGRRVVLWGHSFGAGCAMGGAALTENVSHVILYEPSLGLMYPPGSIEKIEDAIETGNREAAIVEVLSGILEMSDEEICVLRENPQWSSRLAIAHTIARECRAEEGWVFDAGKIEGITSPTLLLAGTDSVPEVRRATDAALGAIQGAVVVQLDGHGHFAHKTDPEMVADLVRRFASDS